MGFFRGPNIIKEKLVQMVDAANVKSYVTGSKIWTNLKDRSDSFCLINTPSFSTASFNGALTFASASNQYASSSGTFIEDNFINNEDFTIGAFIKPTANSVGGNGRSAVYANQRYKTEPGSGGFGLNIINNKYCLNLTEENMLTGVTESFESIAQMDIVSDVPQYITYTWNSGSSAVKAYKNGELIETSTNSNYAWTTSSSSPQPVHPRMALSTQGGWGNYFGADYYHFHLYKKTLSDNEVNQNYNALKARFNL